PGACGCPGGRGAAPQLPPAPRPRPLPLADRRARAQTMIEPGTPAPDFSLRNQDGEEVSLESLRGGTVVLVFYPLDFSPVCTDQLNVYQEVLGELHARGVEMYAV